MIKGKLVLAEPGGKNRVEFRAGQGLGWLVLEFSYNEDGKRSKTGEKRSAADGYVVQQLKKDPEFWELFVRLANHPDVRGFDDVV